MTLQKIFSNVLKLLVKYKSAFAYGVWMTLKLSVVTVILGLIVGSFIALLRLSELRVGKVKPLSFIAAAYVEVIRGTPLLLQIYFFVFLLPSIVPALKSETEICVLIALVLNSGGYVAEIIRSGIAAVDPGQTEAARCLGLNSRQTMWKIVMPQAVKNILPAMGNELISMIKETSMASVFFIGEITTQCNIIAGAAYLPIESIIISGLLYLILTATLSRFVNYYERRLKVSD